MLLARGAAPAARCPRDPRSTVSRPRRPPGLGDKGLLQSAVARPLHRHAYAGQPDVIEMAMLYTAGIVRNRPFIDGNKRTGLVTGVLFLELNGLSFVASEEDATQAVFGLAGGTLDEAAYTTWLRANSKRRRNR